MRWPRYWATPHGGPDAWKLFMTFLVAEAAAFGVDAAGEARLGWEWPYAQSVVFAAAVAVTIAFYADLLLVFRRRRRDDW